MVCLIGLGRIGMTNASPVPGDLAVLTHAQAISQSEGFMLEAGIDPNDSARLEFVGRYSTPAWSSLHELPEKWGRDLVVIAVPTSYHLAVVQELIERGAPRAIFIEKPMGSSKAEAEAIAKLCLANDTQVFVNYHRAVLASTKTIRNMFENGTVSDPYSGDALISGDRLTNASHMVDLLLDWLGPLSNKWLDSRHDGLWLDFNGCQVLMRQIKPSTFSIFELSFLAMNGRLRVDGWRDRWWWEGIVVDPVTMGYDCLGEPQLHYPLGSEIFMTQVYEHLSQALSKDPSSLRGIDRALEVHDVLEGWV